MMGSFQYCLLYIWLPPMKTAEPMDRFLSEAVFLWASPPKNSRKLKRELVSV